MRVLGRRLPNGKPQGRLRFRALRSKTLALRKRIAIIFLQFKDFPRGQGLRLGACIQKTRRFAFAFLSPQRHKTWFKLSGVHARQPFLHCSALQMPKSLRSSPKKQPGLSTDQKLELPLLIYINFSQHGPHC